MADEPREELGGKTPLEHAETPAMDRIARSGIIGRAQTVPDTHAPGSDVANMSLLGYDPQEYFSGRAPIEAAGLGLELDSRDTAFRCNLVIIDHGVMKDYSAGHIASDEAYRLIDELAAGLSHHQSVRLHRGVSYRHIAVIRDYRGSDLVCTPPHDILGQSIDSHLPRGAESEQVRSIMLTARRILAQSAVNADRRKRGLPPVTDIWLWGQGQARRFPSLRERFSITGSVISAVDLVRGLGALAGLRVRTVDGATGYLDTNYEGKVAAAKEALAGEEFVFVHVEAPDETSHEGSLEKKIQAIEDFDRRIVAPLLEYAESLDQSRVLVMPDHATLLSTRTHDRRPVPFALSGAGIAPDAHTRYNERIAETSDQLYTGVSLFERFIRL
jgi:2,3-bisphosphoglycerate-independent phosphoglycerate mutase